MKDFPDTQPTSLYEAAIGPKRKLYYVDRFEIFDENGPGLHPSWNWAAFFFTGFWALYRKLYSWFAIWIFVFAALGFLNIISRNSTIGTLLVGIGNLAIVVTFAVYANSLYHKKIKALIDAAQQTSSDGTRLKKRLTIGGGVHTWVAVSLWGLLALGFAVLVIPPVYTFFNKQPPRRQEIPESVSPAVIDKSSTNSDQPSEKSTPPNTEANSASVQSLPQPENKADSANSSPPIHLRCINNALGGLTGNASFWKENGRLNYQHMSIIYRDGQIDQYGGVARISETPAQFRVEYQRLDQSFKSVTILDRITGRLSTTDEISGKSPTTQHWECQAIKPKL